MDKPPEREDLDEAPEQMPDEPDQGQAPARDETLLEDDAPKKPSVGDVFRSGS